MRRIFQLPEQAAMQLKSENSGTPNFHSTFVALSSNLAGIIGEQ